MSYFVEDWRNTVPVYAALIANRAKAHFWFAALLCAVQTQETQVWLPLNVLKTLFIAAFYYVKMGTYFIHVLHCIPFDLFYSILVYFYLRFHFSLQSFLCMFF